MQSGANAYYKTATVTMSPRELEASLLLKAARQLQTVQDDWNTRLSDLADALDYDKKLWTFLLALGLAGGIVLMVLLWVLLMAWMTIKVL